MLRGPRSGPEKVPDHESDEDDQRECQDPVQEACDGAPKRVVNRGEPGDVVEDAERQHDDDPDKQSHRATDSPMGETFLSEKLRSRVAVARRVVDGP